MRICNFKPCACTQLTPVSMGLAADFMLPFVACGTQRLLQLVRHWTHTCSTEGVQQLMLTQGQVVAASFTGFIVVRQCQVCGHALRCRPGRPCPCPACSPHTSHQFPRSHVFADTAHGALRGTGPCTSPRVSTCTWSSPPDSCTAPLHTVHRAWVLQGTTWQQAVQWLPEAYVEPGVPLAAVARHDTYGITFSLPGATNAKPPVVSTSCCTCCVSVGKCWTQHAGQDVMQQLVSFVL